MAAGRSDEAKDLLDKAANELLAASVLVGSAMGESLVYHAQQAVEKALKGFLAAAGEQYNKVKTIDELVKLCASQNPAFLDANIRGLDSAGTAYAQAKALVELVQKHMPV